jgi:hypothetical protein
MIKAEQAEEDIMDCPLSEVHAYPRMTGEEEEETP